MTLHPGVFTTLRVVAGRPWLFEAHLARLRDGAARFGLAPPPGDAALREEIASAVHGLADARVRVTLGPQGARVEARAYAAPATPWTLRAVRAPWSPGEDTMRWKTTAREGYDRCRREAGSADDALLHDAAGSWLETTVANVFLVMEDGSLRTPPASLPLLPGIAREAVLEEARRAGLDVREAACGAAEAARAREFFVTNALFLVHPVAAVEGVGRFPEGPVARRLRGGVLTTAPLPRIIPPKESHPGGTR